MTVDAATMTITEPAEDPLAAFMRLVDGLAQRHAEPTVQRSVPRYPFNVPVAVHVQSPSGHRDALADAWAQDLSYEDITLLAPIKLPHDKRLFVNFEPVIGKPRFIQIRLTYSRKLVDGIFMSGGSFVWPQNGAG